MTIYQAAGWHLAAAKLSRKLCAALAVRSSSIYAAWIAWCKSNGEAETSNKAFSLKLEEKGFKKTKRKNGVWFIGIGLNANPGDEPDE